MDNNTHKETKEKGRDPRRQRFIRRIYWIPLSVFILGTLTIFMFILINQINMSKNRDFALNDAVMDLRVRIAAFHLWLEEAVTGDEEVDMKEVWFDIDQAVHLLDTMLKGGITEHGLVLEPMEDTKRRTEVEYLKSLLTRLKYIGLQRRENPLAAGIGSPLDKNFDALYKEIDGRARNLENVVETEQAAKEATSRRLFWSILLLWACVVGGATAGLCVGEVRRRHAENALEKAKDQLEIKVAERTKELRDVNDRLRSLSSELLTAQEKERKRTAAELHDEIGASLAVLRIEFTLIENRLSEAQTELRERCRRNLEYIEQIADNVSRLSRNLSPYLRPLGCPSLAI